MTIFEADDEDSFDEDTEITEAVSLDTDSSIHASDSRSRRLPLTVLALSLSPSSGLLALCEV